MKTHINRARRHFRLKHDLLILILVVVLCTFAVLSAVAWLIAHVLILAGVALIIGTAYHLGRRGRRQARPGQVQQQVWPTEPAAASALRAATLPQADYDWDEEPGTRQPASVSAGSDSRDKLLADPRSGVRPLSQLRSP